MNKGEYVRVKVNDYKQSNTIISKIVMIIQNDFVFIEDSDLLVDKNDIINSSPNIIELFEEHDLVVIEYYSLRYEERVTRLFEVTYKDNNNIVLDNAKCSFMLINNDFNEKDKELEPIIKSIVTHEQFKAMEYEVE